MGEQRFKTPTLNMGGTKVEALSNFIYMNTTPNIVHHCQYEIALEMTNPPLNRIHTRRVRGIKAHGEFAVQQRHHKIPQDTPIGVHNGTIMGIYKNFAFRGQTDRWLPDPRVLIEQKTGKKDNKNAERNDRVQTFSYAYFLCKLLNLDEITIMIRHHEDTDYTKYGVADFPESESYLDKCVRWATGKWCVTWVCNEQYCSNCHLRGDDGKMVYPCPYDVGSTL